MNRQSWLTFLLVLAVVGTTYPTQTEHLRIAYELSLKNEARSNRFVNGTEGMQPVGFPLLARARRLRQLVGRFQAGQILCVSNNPLVVAFTRVASWMSTSPSPFSRFADEPGLSTAPTTRALQMR